MTHVYLRIRDRNNEKEGKHKTHCPDCTVLQYDVHVYVELLTNKAISARHTWE